MIRISNSVKSLLKSQDMLQPVANMLADRFSKEGAIVEVTKSRRKGRHIRVTRLYISDGYGTAKVSVEPVAEIALGKYSSGYVGFTSVEYI